MCFSASASFTAAAVLGTLGVISLMRCRTKRARMIAAIPFLFGIQQFAEGIVWITINKQPSLAYAPFVVGGAWIFLLFAFVIWPLWVPFAALRYEGIKRPGGIAVAHLAAMGVIIASMGLYILFTQPHKVVPEADCCHIVYKGLSSLVHFEFGAWIYLLVTTGPLILSSKRFIQYIGLAIIFSYGLTAYAWEYAFTSVWCFFAAIISGYIAVIIDRL